MKAPREIVLVLVLVTLMLTSSSLALDPFSLGAAVGFGAASTAVYAGWNKLKCRVVVGECCEFPDVANDFGRLERQLRENVFGQHLALQSVVRALRSHVKRPKKALTLSFHGWTGGGKNFVAKQIAESLYEKGLKSAFVHLFVSTLHFPDPDKVDLYKLQLQDWIRGNVSDCGSSLFIFDEMDKMAPGLIDAIKPFIDYHESLFGVDFRRSVFIFLSNTGGREITRRAHELWAEGVERDKWFYKDFEALINRGAFNEDGGLRGSVLIESNLVDLFVPFLPMEREHVRMCVEAEAKHFSFTRAQIESIVDSMTYWNNLYSTTGCKRVAQKVAWTLEETFDDL